MSKSRDSDSRRPFRRPVLQVLLKRLQEPRRFIQILAGSRQSGKTTLARQAMSSTKLAAHYASADEPALRDTSWIEAQWEIGRALTAQTPRRGGLLVLDEIQKIPGWSETVKRLWDADSRNRTPLRVMALGCAPLLVQRGLTESLAGRFEIVQVPHWSFSEMTGAFGWTLDQFVYFGGYPGAAPLIGDQERWALYIIDSLVETTISRDVLLLTRVDKPALLRQLFRLGCDYSAQILSYQKMLGQLQDAGNTTTLAHYLELLAGAGMLTGLQKYSGSRVMQRGSSPKLLVLNTALMTASSGRTFSEARADGAFWGRLVESAVGAHLVNSSRGTGVEVFYWRDRGREVDFILSDRDRTTAFEVKSGGRREALPGLEAFAQGHRSVRRLLVGGDGIPVADCLRVGANSWLTGKSPG